MRKFCKEFYQTTRICPLGIWSLAIFLLMAILLPSLTMAETITPPFHSESLLVSDSSRTYDETAYAATEENALSFTGFEAAANTTTVFGGGWWDFQGGNFPTNVANDRTITIKDGAVVTNVASMPQASVYNRNKFNILGASRFHVAGDVILDYGGTTINQSNELWVSEASSFVAGGDIVFGKTATTSKWRPKTGSSLKVEGLGSYVRARNLKMPITIGAPGGCRAVVTDNAVLDIENDILIGTGSHTHNNSLCVTDGGAVTAATVRVGVGASANEDYDSSGYEVHILNGGILRADTEFRIGSNSKSENGSCGVKLVISNGTFSAAKFLPFGVGKNNKNSAVRVSGPQAKFEVEDVSSCPLFGMAGGNVFIVENGAKVDFPWTTCSISDSSSNGTVFVSGTDTVFNLRDSFSLSGSADNPTAITGFTNSLCIVDGGMVTGAFVRVSGDSGMLSVSNGTLLVSSATCAAISAEPISADAECPALTAGVCFRYGGASTNCTVRFSGTSPRIACVDGASADLRGSTKLVFDIPETGYDYKGNNYVPFDVSNLLAISENCEIVVNGLDSKAAKGAIVANGGTVPLVRAKTLVVGHKVLAAAKETLPKGYSLSISGAAGVGQTLSLCYLPGFIIVVR